MGECGSISKLDNLSGEIGSHLVAPTALHWFIPHNPCKLSVYYYVASPQLVGSSVVSIG